VIGDGSLREELKSYAECIGIADKILFLGNRKDIPELLSAIDIFVLSSIKEGLPIALVEAAAARKPIISTNIGSIRRIVRNEVNGLLVPLGNRTALKEAMIRLIENPQLREKMGERGKKIAMESFSLAHMMDQYKDLYYSIVEGTHVWN
jgi:glycosyltransferase involved in cell wall biosynthesis